jgi:hypothetical protein
MTKGVNYYVEGRVFEWAMGLSMFFVGIQFLIWPDTIGGSAFQHLTAVMSQQTLTWVLLFIGWSRCSALMLNGQRLAGIKFGPHARAVGSILSAVIWAQFVIALMQLSIIQGYPSPGIPFWATFTLGEIYVAYTTVKNG